MAEAPATIGRYEVIETLGKGAMGVVYKAVDPVIGRMVAIKTIRLSLSEEELAFYEARFAQEVKTVGKLNHPNVVTIFDVGRTDELAYMAMEYIDGPELKMLMAPGKPLDTATAVDIAAQVAEGLALAHSRGIIHRDVKPSNVMIVFGDERMTAKVTDFGIARGATSAVKTMAGVILGSPRYMSPEQVTGQALDARSDVFSLGVVLYEMLAGAAPFDSENVNSIMYKTVNEPEAPLERANAAVPGEIGRAVARAMAKSPDGRFATMKDFALVLREIAHTLPAPQARLELATPAPTATGSFAGIPLTQESSRGGMSVSSAFDSREATLRLVKITEPSLDTARIAMVAPAAATEAKPAAPSPDPPPASTAHESAPEPAFPIVPAAILGSLALLALALGIALAL